MQDAKSDNILRNVSSYCLLILTCCALLVIPASAQHFKQVKGALAHVAAGRNEVFGVDATAKVWRYNSTTKAFEGITGVSLVSVAVGGGTVSQLDDVWGLTLDHNIYRFNFSKGTFVHYGGLLSQIVVGEGVQDNCHPYEVWGINSSSAVFRYNYCTKQFLPAGTSSLAQIATGGGDVWGLDSSGGVYHFDFATQSFTNPVFTHLSQITVGVNDTWGIGLPVDGSFIARYDPNTASFGTVKGSLAQIVAGGDGVWGVASNNEIFRFDPSSNAFVQVGGALSNIAVGSGAGVFGVNQIDSVYTFVRP